MSKKNVLKKICAVMLAFVTILTAGLSINLDNAKAASMEVGTKIFQEPGIDVFGDGKHSTFSVKFAEGQNAYCVEYGVDIVDLGSFVPTNTPDVVLGPQQRNQIAYALAYGYEPAYASINTAENRAKYVMTQTIIWCITEGYWGSSMVSTARDRMAVAFSSVYSNVSIQFCQEYFNKLRSDMTLAMSRVTPCNLSTDRDLAQTITLNWNAANGRYQRTLTDANGVLSAFDFSGLSAQGINHTISGNNIIFYTSASNSGMTTPVLTVNPKDGSYADEHCTTNVIYWGNGTSDQTIVTRTMIPDPIKAYVRFNTETSTLRIKKVSSDNNQPLNNVTFDIYKDAACTSLVKSVITQTIGGEAGVADVTGLGVGLTYYIRERAGAGATNHQLLKDPVPVTIKSSDNVITISNHRVPVTVELTKTDEKTGSGVTGAVYSIYARENIKAAAGDSILYNAGDWVADFPVTDENGKAVLENLYIGKYFVKEKSAPPSGEYLLDTTEYEVDASANSKDFASDAVIRVNVSVVEKRSPGLIKIEKTDSETGEMLSGAEFGIYSDRDCTKLVQTLVTDENGEAVSKTLNEGTYYVQELKTPAGYVTDVTVHSTDVAPARAAIVKAENDPITVTITKTSVTGDCPEIPGATLVIKDSEGNEVESWVSATEPHMIERLPVGTYTLTELRTPFGYQVAEIVEFTVLDTNEIQTVTMVDAETYGKVVVTKTDEATEEPLAGVTFEVRYAEDVLNAEGSVAIEAGTVADILVTDGNGYAESKLLPIGTYGPEGWTSYIQYELIETETLEGYVLDDTVYEVRFEYVDDKTPVVEKTFDITNEIEETEAETEPESEPETEPESESETEPESEPETDTEVTTTQGTPAPKTGDLSTGAVWITILLVSVLILFLIINLKLKEH